MSKYLAKLLNEIQSSLLFRKNNKLTNLSNFNVDVGFSIIYKRCYPAPPKRFYRRTSVLFNDGQYEITLDQRKLKTPRGSIFKVDSEPLALAVAFEWDSQKEKIQQSNMHLTALCSTVIDNPNNNTKFDLVQHLSNFLDTDTVLYHSGRGLK
uniref:ATP synthase mitochondrial F1 complex assembly factor 2 n=1 Tax=Clastoptera arizonana TaxID=38151 RepID=A0A1B6C1V7_9HEMI